MKIEAVEVVKRFGAHRALDGLSMTVPSGAVYGLVGPNGAGKTTAIRHIAGILRPDGGEVLADGVPVFENVDAKARMAYIPDEVFYFPQASVNDMMHFYRGVYPGFDSQRFERLAEAFPIDRKMPMRRFSRGMKKQAAFWLALSLRPELLVLDEPVDGLDPVMRRQVWSLLLSDVAEHGTGVLVSSHNLRELEDVCDMVGFINNGKMLLERQLSELQDTAGHARRAGHPGRPGCAARLRPRQAEDAHSPGRAGGGHRQAGARRAAVCGRGASDPGGNLHIRAGR